MNAAQAALLKPGDLVLATTWFSGTPPRITRVQFKERGEGGHSFQMSDGSSWNPARLHHTKGEAYEDVRGLILVRLQRLQALLLEWERHEADWTDPVFTMVTWEGKEYGAARCNDNLGGYPVNYVAVKASNEINMCDRLFAVLWLTQRGLLREKAEELIKGVT